MKQATTGPNVTGLFNGLTISTSEVEMEVVHRFRNRRPKNLFRHDPPNFSAASAA